jgi:hypothetical protein
MQTARFALLALAFAVGGAAAYTYGATLPGARPACAAPATPMARLELLFGAGRKDGGEVSDQEWRAFLDGEVTPRFPDGLTVLGGYGQWKNSAGAIAKEPSRVLVIWHKPDADSNLRIEGVRAAYKARFGQESVMRVDSTSCVSF